MKNSWQTQSGPLLLRPQTNLDKYQKKIVWPFIWSGLFLSQGKDILGFGGFWLFKRKRLINQSFSPKVNDNELKKCRTRREHFVFKFLQKNDNLAPIETTGKKVLVIFSKNKVKIFKINWFKAAFLTVLIVIQLPAIQKNWQITREKGSAKIIQEKREVTYLPLPKEINFSQQNLIEIEETKIATTFSSEEASWSANLTQVDKANLALASFYKSDWANYQKWLNDAKAMDPNVVIFK